MRRSDLVQHKEKDKGGVTRTSQIVFGERQHLLRVLDSLEGTDLPIARLQQERRILEDLIHARTRDLNQINTAWDEKTLNKLAKHPYGAIRENVARHPNADAGTLTWLSKDRSQPLWYLVAFNPNTPTPLQRRLRDRLKKLGENQLSR